MCDLRVSDKLYILRATKDRHNTDKRNKIEATNVHRYKYKLGNINV